MWPMYPTNQPKSENPFSIVWDEHVHTFTLISFDQFVHYERPLWTKNSDGRYIRSTSADDKPCAHEKSCAPKYATRTEAEVWIRSHNPPNLTEDDVFMAVRSMEGGTFGPMDNPKANDPQEA